MEDSEFDQLLKRYLNGEVSEHEKIKIEAWLEVMKTGDNKLLELSPEAEETLFQKITADTTDVSEVIALVPRKPNKNKWILQIAASVLFLCLIGLTAWYYTGRTITIAQAPAEQIKKLILNDGTIVWLKDHRSSITYVEKLNEGIRYAHLNGEALFEVAKDPAHPFIIECNSIKVKVIGTSFSLTSTSSAFELNVLTGNIQVFSQREPNGILVTAKERATISTDGTLIKEKIKSDDASKIIAGTEYDMAFSNASVEAVISRLQAKFNITASFENQEIKRCRITADFTDQSLESVLLMLSEVLNLEYSIDNDKLTLSGKGCMTP